MELWRKCEIQLAMFVRNRTQVDPQLAVRTDLQCVSLPQVVTRAEGKVHSLTLRNVTLAEAGSQGLPDKSQPDCERYVSSALSTSPLISFPHLSCPVLSHHLSSPVLLLFPILISPALSFLMKGTDVFLESINVY